jgi:hypothetical protein
MGPGVRRDDASCGALVFNELPGFNFSNRSAIRRRKFATSRRDAPEALMKPSAQRGRGERRVPVAPAGSCALCIGKKHTSKRVHRNHPAFPHAMVLTVSFELSPVTGLFATVAHGYVFV